MSIPVLFLEAVLFSEPELSVNPVIFLEHVLFLDHEHKHTSPVFRSCTVFGA